MHRLNLTRLGGRIRRHRKRLKLSQQALAKMLGAESRTTAWEWEHGERAPSTEQLITLARVFGIRFTDLVPEAEDPVPAEVEAVKAAG